MNQLLITGSVFSTQQFGGVSRYLVELGHGAGADPDWKVRFAAPLYVNRYLREYRQVLDHRGLFFRNQHRGLSRLNDFLVKRLSPSMLKDASVIHEGFFDSETMRMASGAKIATVYDMISERFFPRQSSLKKKQDTVDVADRLVAISEATKEDMCHFLDVPAEKIQVIHLAASIRPTDERASQVPDRPFLLWVGTRKGYKNFGTLVKALGISRRFRQELLLVCAGGPPLTAEERSLWQDASLDEKSLIQCLPDEKELASLYCHADALVYVSKYEGFGMPPLEAMQCKCPVIASNCSSIPEVVGDAAELVDPDDAECIADAIDRLIGQSELSSALIEKGYRRAESFQWKHCVAQHLQLYREVL